MSIATELSRIAAAKAALKDAINAKGGSLTDETIDAYPAAVTALPTGSNVDLSGVTLPAGADGSQYLYKNMTAIGKDGTLVTGSLPMLDSFIEMNNIILPLGAGISHDTTIMLGGDVDAANIKKGAVIAGLVGTYEGESFDFSEATLIDAGDLAINVVAYGFDGEKVVGTSPLYTGDNIVINDAEVHGLPDGIYRGVSYQVQDNNLTAANIKSGVTILGITGTYEGSDNTGGSGGSTSPINVDPDKVISFKLTGTIETEYEQHVFLDTVYTVVDASKTGRERSWSDGQEFGYLESLVGSTGWYFWETQLMDNTLSTTESNPFTATAWTGMDVTSANLVFEILEYGDSVSAGSSATSGNGNTVIVITARTAIGLLGSTAYDPADESLTGTARKWVDEAATLEIYWDDTVGFWVLYDNDYSQIEYHISSAADPWTNPIPGDGFQIHAFDL